MLLHSLLQCTFVSTLLFIHNTVATSPPLYKAPPPTGNATLTHYDLPFNYVASCGCVGLSTRYPTAAMNSLSYGSSNSYGPQCGVCYKLTLLSTPLTPPPPKGTGKIFSPNDKSAPSVIVKITDACPLGGNWCTQTALKPLNPLGSQVHFDLAWPSRAIKNDFFPTDDGRDYGAWWSQYELVDCNQWAGYNDKEAWGSDWNQENSACCPLRPSMTNEAAIKNASSTLTDTGSYDIAANTQHCPSYTGQLAAGVTLAQLAAQVPNTSNILSRRKAGTTNGAANNMLASSFFWKWIFMSEADTPAAALQDWRQEGRMKPTLLQQLKL